MVEGVDDGLHNQPGGGSGTKPTPEQLAAYNKAFSEFQEILTELINEDRGVTVTPVVAVAPSDNKSVIQRLKYWCSWLCNRARGWWDRVRGFEDLVADYTKILHTLETKDGQIYSQMALFGIKALQKRKLEIAEKVHVEVLFKTEPSEALNQVLLALGLSVVILLFIGIFPPALLIKAPTWFNLNADSTSNYYNYGVHLYVAFCFGCLGSLIGFVGRPSNFDGKQARSKNFLRVYGFTIPLVGGGFALAIAAALDAGMIQILHNTLPVFIVAGFLAGVSERFKNKLLDMVERAFGSNKSQ